MDWFWGVTIVVDVFILLAASLLSQIIWSLATKVETVERLPTETSDSRAPSHESRPKSDGSDYLPLRAESFDEDAELQTEIWNKFVRGNAIVDGRALALPNQKNGLPEFQPLNVNASDDMPLSSASTTVLALASAASTDYEA